MNEGNYTPEDVKQHYSSRHLTRGGIYKKLPFANYGYWPRDNMTVDEACEELVHLLARELELGEDIDLLECGCGYGAAAIVLASHHPVRHITGRDITDVRVETGRGLVAERGLSDKIALGVGDATRLEFPDASFPRLLAIECAFHFPTRDAFFREAFRVLKPGGLLVMTDIVIAPEVDVASQSLEDLRRFMSAEIKKIPDTNLYNEAEYRNRLTQAGFGDLHLYSIKDKCILQFADAIEQSADSAAPENRAKRIQYANSFREEFMPGADYIVVKARKPAA